MADLEQLTHEAARLTAWEVHSHLETSWEDKHLTRAHIPAHKDGMSGPLR